MVFVIALLGVAGVANAVCPEQPVSLCRIVAQNRVVVRAKVASIQQLVDEDDPEGVSGWMYHLDVVKDYRYGKPGQLAIMSENTTARISLETGKEYIVFASRIDQDETKSMPAIGFKRAVIAFLNTVGGTIDIDTYRN